MSYTPPSISGYNSTPPSDDGAQTSANRLYWSTIKTKLADPLKNYIDSINIAVDNGFAAQFLSTIDDKSSTFTVGTADDGKFYNCTSALTVNLPPASSVGEGFHIAVFNNSVGTITVDGDSAETINGSATATLTVQYEAMFLICSGSGWFATYLPLPARLVTSITGNLTIGGTLGVTGKTTTAASATGGAGFNIPHGTAPTSPVNGDIWTTTSGVFARINGTNVQVSGEKRIIQRAYKSTTTNDSTALTVPDDNTIPQNSECKVGLTADAFTPTSATSKLRISYSAMISNSSASTTGMLLLFKDSDAGALKTSPALVGNGDPTTIYDYYEMTAGTTSAITFKLYFGGISGTTYFLSDNGTVKWGGTVNAHILIEEIEA